MIASRFNSNNQIIPNDKNNNILQEIANDIYQIMDHSKDNFILKSLANIIDKINFFINANKKNL